MLNPDDDTLWPLADGRLPLVPDAQPKLQVKVASKTHVGKMRKRNEDHHAVIRRTRHAEMLSTNLPPGTWAFGTEEAYLLLVADGVGGAASGDQASQLAVKTVLDLAERASSWVMKYHTSEFDAFRNCVELYLELIQREFLERAKREPELQSMGTTLTLAVVLPPHALVVQIGDSRAYCLRDHKLQQITRDQTLAQEMLDEGADPADARQYSNVLTNSLRCDATRLQAEVIHVELQADDRLLLCSDGLTDLVDDEAIAEVLADCDPDTACAQLVERALDAGGYDNVTVIVSALEACQTVHREPGVGDAAGE